MKIVKKRWLGILIKLSRDLGLFESQIGVRGQLVFGGEI